MISGLKGSPIADASSVPMEVEPCGIVSCYWCMPGYYLGQSGQDVGVVMTIVNEL